MSKPSMRRSAKPVRKCHACPLNLGDHCWRYAYPRKQWRDGRQCPGRFNTALIETYRLWCKQPSVKSRRQLRQEAFRSRPPATRRRDPPGDTGTAT
jgi:hypothetical protein